MAWCVRSSAASERRSRKSWRAEISALRDCPNPIALAVRTDANASKKAGDCGARRTKTILTLVAPRRQQRQPVRARLLCRRLAEGRGNGASCEPFGEFIAIVGAPVLPGFASSDFHQ